MESGRWNDYDERGPRTQGQRRESGNDDDDGGDDERRKGNEERGAGNEDENDRVSEWELIPPQLLRRGEVSPLWTTSQNASVVGEGNPPDWRSDVGGGRGQALSPPHKIRTTAARGVVLLLWATRHLSQAGTFPVFKQDMPWHT